MDPSPEMVHMPTLMGGKKPKKKDAKVAKAGLYVARYLTKESAKQLHAWAKEQGFPNITPPEEMHITLVYSHDPVMLVPDQWEMAVDLVNPRIVPLGDEGAVVLMFDSEALKYRWEQTRKLGASWSYPDYHPHITLTYDIGDFDYRSVPPIKGQIMLQPERHAEIKPKAERTDKMNFIKINDDKRLVYGWASVIKIGGKTVVDWQEDAIEVNELQKGAHKFISDMRKAKAMHKGAVIGEVVESMVFTKELQEALGIDLGQIGWFIVMKIHDEDIWDKVKKGVFKAFSIGGSAKRVEVDAADLGDCVYAGQD
jgi:hypothetical protein